MPLCPIRRCFFVAVFLVRFGRSDLFDPYLGYYWVLPDPFDPFRNQYPVIVSVPVHSFSQANEARFYVSGLSLATKLF